MKRVRWGVIGAGGIAQRRTIPEGIVPASNSELIAVYDVTQTQAVAERFGVVGCDSEEALLAHDIDAVYIATPVYLHAEQIQRAARSKKHILVEKPLSLDLAEAQQLQDVCEREGVKLGVGLMMRFHACHAMIRDMIAGGQIGKPVFARAQLSCWYPPMQNAWRQNKKLGGGGALMDLGCHCIDLLEQFLGPITSLTCQTARVVQPYEVEDSAVVTLRFGSGAIGVVDCLFSVPDESSLNRLEVYGSEGSLMCEGTIGQSAEGSITARLRTSTGGYDASQQRFQQATRQLTPKPFNMYRAQIEAFADCILQNVPPPVDGKAGLHLQRVLAACYDSAERGVSVVL